MNTFLQLAFELAVILLAAKLGGFISSRLHQPSVLGELIIGLLLGPSLIDVIHLPFISDPELLKETVNFFGEIGVLLLMFLAGLELHLPELVKNFRVSAFAGSLGVIIPVGLGYLTGVIYGMDPNHAVFLGLTLGATSVSISAQTLMEMNKLKGKIGLSLLGAAVFDDILVILLLSGFLAFMEGTGSVWAFVWIFVRMLLFFLLSASIGWWVLPWLMRKIGKLPISQGILTLSLVIVFSYGIASELVGGMAAITGAFLAGLFLARTAEKPQIDSGMRSVAYGLFVPIFFINIGLGIDLHTVPVGSLLTVLIITIVAVVGKIIGAGTGALLAKYPLVESLQLATGMVSRGEVGLIVASVGLSQGLLSSEIFTAIIGTVLITTLITPPLLKSTFKFHVKDPSLPVQSDPDPKG
jgi:Kef-type K+ transport system membrane component KefB